MSGGSMNYLFAQLDDAVFDTSTPERAAFCNHLKKVSKALHDIEWVDSYDYAPGDEVEAIMACISESDVLAAAVERAEVAHGFLEEAIFRAKGALRHTEGGEHVCQCAERE